MHSHHSTINEILLFSLLSFRFWIKKMKKQNRNHRSSSTPFSIEFFFIDITASRYIAITHYLELTHLSSVSIPFVTNGTMNSKNERKCFSFFFSFSIHISHSFIHSLTFSQTYNAHTGTVWWKECGEICRLFLEARRREFRPIQLCERIELRGGSAERSRSTCTRWYR